MKIQLFNALKRSKSISFNYNQPFQFDYPRAKSGLEWIELADFNRFQS